MGDAHYPLKVVLRLRGRERDAAKEELGAAIGELRRREEALKRAREAVKVSRAKIDVADDERMAAFVGGADLRDLRVMQDYRSALEVDLVRANEDVEFARTRVGNQRLVVDRARSTLADAQRALMGVEEHFAAWSKAQDLKRRRKEADVMDEVATRIWLEDTR